MVSDILWIDNHNDREISHENSHYPFWNENMRDNYNNVWLYDKNIQIAETRKLNNNHNNWFYTKQSSFNDAIKKKIYYLPLLHDKIEKSNIRIKKIKLKILSQTKNILNEWSHLYRYAYNRAVWYFNETGLTGYALRDCVKSDIQWCMHPFVKKLPTELREGAAKEVIKAIKAAFTNYSQGTINSFDIHYRSKKKMKKWTLQGFQKRSYTKTGKNSFNILRTYCPYQFYASEYLPDTMDHDFGIHFDGIHYYLLIPYEIQCQFDKINGDVISLDPGIRTFQTAYHSNNINVKEICTGRSVAYLHSIAIQLDRMISARSRGCWKGEPKNNKTKQKFRKKISCRIDKIRLKLKNLQRELHNQTSNYLTNDPDSAQTILLPQFKTQSMSKKVKRKLSIKNIRNMSLLAHHAFQQKLKTKAEERGSCVLICTEHFTSRTCGRCGHLNDKSSAKIFHCESCKMTIDRDINAARNIMLRAMRDSAVFGDMNMTV